MLTKTCGAMKAQLTTVTAEANALAQERRWERAAAPPQVASAAEIRAYAEDGDAEADEPSFERPRTAQPRVLVSTPPRALIQSRSMVEVGSLLKTRPASASGRRG